MIVGAGVAGCVCGYLLEKAGVDCVVVDWASFPREKVCGGGLTPKAYGLLEGLMPGLRYGYEGVRRFRLMLEGRTLCVVDLERELRMVRRRDFDYGLLREYEGAGGELVKGAFERFEELAEGGIRVTLRSGEVLDCDWLVGADGANSRVRRQLTGRRSGGSLWVEEYVEKGAREFVFEFSSRYRNGYWFRFPSVGRDVVGMGGLYSSLGELEEVRGCRSEGVQYGGRIPLDTVDSGKDNVILIGDAGGFANKLTYEGLYYAIATGRNASRAIVEGRSFADTNRDIFRRKRKEVYITRLFYSRLGLGLMRLGAHCPRLIKRAFELNY